MKKIISLLLAFQIMTTVVSANSDVGILLNNSVIEFNESTQKPTKDGDVLLLPIRVIAESANAIVDWIDNTAVINIRGNEIKLKNGQKIAIVNGNEVELSVAPKIINDRTMLSFFDTMSLLELKKDLTEYEKGYALHQEFYTDEDKFFNLVTTFYGDAKTTRSFSWEAQEEYDNMVLQYSKIGEENVVEVIPQFEKAPVSFANNVVHDIDISIYDATDVSMMQNMLFYKADLSELDAGTTYRYRIGDRKKDEWSEYYEFTTEPEDLNSFSFIGVTDPQGRVPLEYEYYKNTLKKALEDDSDASFIVNMGDFTDNSFFDDWWKYFFDASKGTCEGLPLMTCIGNHELRGYGGIYYNLRFNNPQNAVGLADGYVSNGNDEVAKPIIENLDNTVYSFDYGNAHFVVLNSGTDWSADQMVPLMELQKEWLDNDLKNTDKQWKIVMIHRGIYTEKIRNDGPREVFLEVLDKNGVDLVIEGHDHIYMRTYQMKNNEKTSDEKENYKKGEGTIYTLIGSAAQKRYDAQDIHPWTAVVKPLPATNPSYTIFEVNENELYSVTKLDDGTVLDEFKILAE